VQQASEAERRGGESRLALQLEQPVDPAGDVRLVAEDHHGALHAWTKGGQAGSQRRSHPGGVVGRYQAALDAGDTDAILQTFQPDGSFREPIGLHALHRGTAELRLFFLQCFSSGGGVKLEQCEVTDDGERCALEYNCVGWGSHDLPPQAGIAVFDRGTDGLLTAVRVYDDVEPPSMPPSSLRGAPTVVHEST